MDLHYQQEAKTDFQYDVFDGNQYSDKATIKINILPSSPPYPSPEANPVNSPPIAEDFSVPLESNQPIKINLIGHAIDKDGDALAASILEQPQFSQIPMIVENDNVSAYYQQSLGTNSTMLQEDSFTYQVNDGRATSNIATITITPQPKLGSGVSEEQLSNESSEIPQQEISDMMPPAQPLANKPPVANDVSGNTEPEKSVDIILNATDEDSNNLTAKLVKEPDCGSVEINQQIGSVRYTANTASAISSSNCTVTKTDEWEDVFTYKVSDGELESNIAKIKINIKSIHRESKTSRDENSRDSDSPKIKLEGPISALPGEKVTLLASLIGIDRNQLTGVHIKQIEGQNVSYSECSISDITCPYPSFSFIMPNCLDVDNVIGFDLVIVENNQNQYNDKFNVKLDCSPGTNPSEKEDRKSSDDNSHN